MMKKVVLVGVLMWVGGSAFSQLHYDTPKQQKWVDSVYNKLNTKEKLAQLFLTSIKGDPTIREVIELNLLTHSNKLGGIYFSKILPAKLVEIINENRHVVRTPLLIGMDVKHGLHDDIPQAFKYPQANTISAIKNPSLLHEMQQHLQEQLFTLGCNTNLSIVEDTISPFLNSDVLYQIGASQVYANSDSENLFYMLSSNDIESAVKKLKKLVRKNLVNGDSIETNVKRILKAKYNVYSGSRIINPDNLILKLTRPKYKVLLEKMYQSAIEINTNTLLPFQMLDTTTFATLTLGGDASIANSYLSKYANFLHFKEENDTTSLIRKLTSFKVVIVNIINPDQLLDKHYQLLKSLSNKTHLVVCYYGENSKNRESFQHIVKAHENNEFTQKLVPQFLFGAISNNETSLNRLGYSIPESVGVDSYVLEKIDNIAHEAISNAATPGCQILIAKDGKVIFDKNYGFYTYDSLRAVTTETIYDLASITKVAATLQTILFMNENGLIDLDYKISYYLPELKNTNKKNMVIRDILSHQAGLWPGLPLWKYTMKNTSHLSSYYSYYPQDDYPNNVSKGLYSHVGMEDKVWQWIMESDLRNKKDRVPYDYKYSDVGYYMLYRLAEKILNQPMEDFLSQNVYEPLGAVTLNYLPLCKFPEDMIAPTENDTDFRYSQIVGTVHDQGAAMIGGVAGHAGLFSNATDLAKLFQMHLQNGRYGGAKYFSEETLEKFRKPQYDSNRRGAGWDKPVLGSWYGPTGENVSSKTYGHTGFTGTAAWVDPEYNLVYIFLSNRVYPDATNAKLYDTNIRTRIQDVIYKAIWSYSDNND
ncbi:MAG: serine hydrolase [Cyclobacteriaceae bacterium]|nr:serine hydrolase [Cyclobacteriaceae bacterium]